MNNQTTHSIHCMSDVELYHYHMAEAQKAFNRLQEKSKELKSKSGDKWLSSKAAAAKYLGISRTTFYQRYIDQGLRWIEGKGIKQSHLDNF